MSAAVCARIAWVKSWKGHGGTVGEMDIPVEGANKGVSSKRAGTR